MINVIIFTLSSSNNTKTLFMQIEKMIMEQLKITYSLAANSPEEKKQLIADAIYTEYKKRMEPTQGKCIVSIVRTINSQYYNN